MNDAAQLQLAPVGELDRRAYLGSSNAAAIMGMGATYDGVTQTQYTVWRAKLGELEDATPDPAREKFLRRRKRWEQPIVEMLREEFDGKIVAVNNRYTDPEHPFLAGEIDFEWVDGDGVIQNGEIKTVGNFSFGEKHGWGEPGTSDIPIHYCWQAMHNLMITGRDTCIVAVMLGIDNMLFYRIDRDEEMIAALRAAELKFWNENVLKRIPPDPQSMEDMKHFLLRMKGRPVQVDEITVKRLARIAAIRAERKAMEDEEETLYMAIGDFVRFAWSVPSGAPVPQEDAAFMDRNTKIASWARQRGAHLDQKRLKIEKPEITAEYTKETQFRVLRFHKPK